jgi:hypothetical protein
LTRLNFYTIFLLNKIKGGYHDDNQMPAFSGPGHYV